MLDEREILRFLDCPPVMPGIRALNRLIDAYIHRVPWESVFRIAKRAANPDPAQCPRWPEEFWQDAMQRGGGGTCYENNYAFFWLLQRLGYEGYLTVNDMGEQRGCHAAIVLQLQGRKLLVDVGIPLLAALLLDPGRATHRSTWMHTYTLRPDGANCYQVLRSRHPKPNIYTLYDIPVRDADFRLVVEQDYGPAGLFLDRVVIVKVIGQRLWRFNSADRPYRLESFGRADREEAPIPEGQVTRVLAERFQMDEDKIAAALRAVA